MKWSKFSLAIVIALASVFIISTTQAKENSLKKGKWALQFEVDREFDLSGFQGQTLSVKKHTADNRAYRLGLTVYLDVGDGETLTIYDDTTQRPRNSDRNSKRLDINLQRIHYTDISAPVNLFYGFGAAASFSHGKFEDNSHFVIDTITFNDHYKSVSDSWSAGVSGIFGAEWFFGKTMSLLGEYSTTVSYGGNTRKTESRQYQEGFTVSSRNSEDKSNSFKISASTVKFGLSIYF